MRNLVLALIATVITVLAASSPAQAGWKDDKAACDAQGGIFDFSNGIVSCDTSVCVGNPDSPGCGQTVDSSTSSHGSFNNKPQKEESCSGPGNSTAQCPDPTASLTGIQ
jgi:hypothetical protein